MSGWTWPSPVREGKPSRTAQYVAQVRAVLHREGLVDDPYARGMLAPTGRVVVALLGVWPLRRLTTSAFFLALGARTAFFDRHVRAAIAAEIDQVVIVGAGYDSRAWRFPQRGVTFYELDHPSTQADKRRRSPSGGPVYVPVDLAGRPVLESLDRAGFDGRRPALVVIEGVTMYLTEREVRSLLAHLAHDLTAGSRLAVNFAAPPRSGRWSDRVRQRLLRSVGAARGERHRFFVAVADAASFVGSTGWHVTEAVSLRDEAVGAFAGRDVAVAKLHPAMGAAVAAIASPT